MAIQIMPTAADRVTTRDVVAANVRAEAARAGFNQVRLGQILGISQPSVNKRWTGKRPWQLEELDSLATALGVSVVDLVTPTGRETRLRQDSNLQPRGRELIDGYVDSDLGRIPNVAAQISEYEDQDVTGWLGVVILEHSQFLLASGCVSKTIR